MLAVVAVLSAVKWLDENLWALAPRCVCWIIKPWQFDA